MLSIERCARGEEEDKEESEREAGKEEGIHKICKENNFKAARKKSKKAKKERKRERETHTKGQTYRNNL